MAGNDSGFRVPQNLRTWRQQKDRKGFSGTITQSTTLKISSASNFRNEHFLGLRIIWKFTKSKKQKLKIPEKIYRQFHLDALKELPGWNAYLKDVAKYYYKGDKLDDSYVPIDVGPFVSVCQFHKHVVTGDKTAVDNNPNTILIEPSPQASRVWHETSVLPQTPAQGARAQVAVSQRHFLLSCRLQKPQL